MLSDASITHGECVHGKFPFLWWQTFEQSFMNHVAYEICIFEDKSKIIVEHFRNKVQCVHGNIPFLNIWRDSHSMVISHEEKNFTDNEQIQVMLLLRLAFSKTNQAKTRSSSLPCIFAKSRLLEPAQSAIKQELSKLIKLKNSAPLRRLTSSDPLLLARDLE